MTLNRAKMLSYLRERYIKPDAIQQAVIVDAPLLGLIPKDESMGGKYMKLPQIRTGAQGRSATYATAKANATGSQTVDFQVQYVNNFQIAKLEGDIINDTQGDENALAEAVDMEVDATVANMKKDLQLGLFGNVGGARGRIGAIGAGNAGANCRITLQDPADAKFFEEGVLLQASANDGTAAGHALRDAGDTIAIVAVDAVNGYLEFAADVTAAIAGLVANDYLFAAGDFKLKISGLGGWIPPSAPTAGDSFHTVDRTVNVQRLSGIRSDCTGMSIEDGFTETAALCSTYDAQPKTGVIHPRRWGAMSRSLGSDAQNRRGVIKGADARVGYATIKVDCQYGVIDVVSDAGCDINEGFLLTLDSWKLGSVGKLVHIVDDDELMIRRGSGDDWAIDVKSRANLGCKAPGKNARMAFAAL